MILRDFCLIYTQFFVCIRHEEHQARRRVPNKMVVLAVCAAVIALNVKIKFLARFLAIFFVQFCWLFVCKRLLVYTVKYENIWRAPEAQAEFFSHPLLRSLLRLCRAINCSCS